MAATERVKPDCELIGQNGNYSDTVKTLIYD